MGVLVVLLSKMLNSFLFILGGRRHACTVSLVEQEKEVWT